MNAFPPRRGWAAGMNLVGILIVAYSLIQHATEDRPALLVVAWAGWSLWSLLQVIPRTWVRVRTLACFVMVAAGGFAGPGTEVVGAIPAAVAVLVLAGAPVVPLPVVFAAGGTGLALAEVAGLTLGLRQGDVISVLTLVGTVTLAGLSRRQYLLTEVNQRQLLEERVAVEQERAQVATLTERSRIARDLHDVLAHSLGGLVIQLEAVDALLESGRTDAARGKVQAARELAVSGLNEARQAVSTLREPDDPLSTVVAALAETHRSLGARVAVRGDADRGRLGPAGRTAVRRAVQELLTNARRHAPGAATTLDLDWEDDFLTVTASTPAGDGRTGATPGGGHGLAGMRERVVEAGGTMTVRETPSFDVVLRLPAEGKA